MKTLFALITHLLTTLVRFAQPGGVRAVAAESLALAHQLLVLPRRRKRAHPSDTVGSSVLRSMLDLAIAESPQKGFNCPMAFDLPAFSRSLGLMRIPTPLFLQTTSKAGAKGSVRATHHRCGAVKCRNPKFGCLKIAQQISYAFGVEVNKDVVRRILQRHYAAAPNGNGPSWLTAIAHAKDNLWSLDLFRCESIVLQSYGVMVIIDVFSRRFIGFVIERGDIDGSAVCRMFSCAISRQGQPKYLSTDHDPLFRFHRRLATLRVLEIEEVKSVPRVPRSHPFVERMIRTIREELLDQVLFCNQLALGRKLSAFRVYYNRFRVHCGSDGVAPVEERRQGYRPTLAWNEFRWMCHCHALFQLPSAA